MRFKQLPTHLMGLDELEEEHDYLTKRIYRLEKLQKMGKAVSPDLEDILPREDDLDIAIRERRRGMSEIPS